MYAYEQTYKYTQLSPFLFLTKLAPFPIYMPIDCAIIFLCMQPFLGVTVSEKIHWYFSS